MLEKKPKYFIFIFLFLHFKGVKTPNIAKIMPYLDISDNAVSENGKIRTKN